MQLTRWFVFWLPFSLWAQVTTSPVQPIAYKDQTITITLSGCGIGCTTTLSGAGSIVSQTGTSVTYQAPTSIIPQSSVLGCPVTPNDSVFNTRADNLPTNSNSATWIAHMSSVPLGFGPAWGITYADGSTPNQGWKPYYGNGNGNYSTVYNFPFPGRFSPLLRRENGSQVGVTGYTANQNDHHMVVVRRSDCEFFETYNDRINFETQTCQDGTTSGCNVSSLLVPYGWGSVSPGNGPYAEPYESTDAAGLPLAPLSWHLNEIKAGVIKHAVRFTASNGYINGAIWPATTANSSAPNAPPYGARFLLKTQANGGPNLSTVCGSNADCVTMLTGLQQYGMMLADIGTNNQTQEFSDLCNDQITCAALTTIANANIGISNFYAVDESSLQQTSAHGFATFSNGSYSVDSGNGYVTPVSSAILTITPSTGSALKLPIALQGTAVGVQSSTVAIVAGSGSYQMPRWVNPSSLSQSITCSFISGTGALNGDCSYTPQATGPSSAVVKYTSVADTNAFAYVYFTVLSSSGGAIRIDTGSPSATTDGNGNTWNADAGCESSLPTTVSDYPYWGRVYQNEMITVLYTRGGDIECNLVGVPNGNYIVKFYTGQVFNGGPGGTIGPNNWFVSNPTHYEAQGQIGAHFWDWNFLSNYLIASTATISIPATVSNNTLEVRTMLMTPDTPTTGLGLAPKYFETNAYLNSANGYKSTNLNAIEILPDTTSPYWTIDTQQASTIAPGQSIQMYQIDHYTGFSSPTWSVTGTGASITTGGLLTLAPGTYLANQPIVVTATNTPYSASATLYTIGSTSTFQ